MELRRTFQRMRDIHELSRTLIEMKVWHPKQAFAQFSNLGISHVRKLSSPGVPEVWSERPTERPGVEGKFPHHLQQREDCQEEAVRSVLADI